MRYILIVCLWGISLSFLLLTSCVSAPAISKQDSLVACVDITMQFRSKLPSDAECKPVAQGNDHFVMGCTVDDTASLLIFVTHPSKVRAQDWGVVGTCAAENGVTLGYGMAFDIPMEEEI